jgi:metal-responsive CopG/Arc/MetJ family transcriptional regulator
MNKQMSLTIPETLFRASKEYSDELGYRSLQEFIVDLMRRRVILENVERYREIEERMKKGRGVKRFSQKGAVGYLKGL